MTASVIILRCCACTALAFFLLLAGCVTNAPSERGEGLMGPGYLLTKTTFQRAGQKLELEYVKDLALWKTLRHESLEKNEQNAASYAEKMIRGTEKIYQATLDRI